MSVWDRKSTMAIQRETLLVVVMVFVLVCEGTITGPGGCTTTCCMTCHLGDNCAICYKLNPPSINCPCLDTLNKAELKRLIQLRDARTEARTGIRTEARKGTSTGTRTEATEARTRTRTETMRGMMTKARTEKDRHGGFCKPVCCPFLSCSESSCPQCYRRHRQNREKCPCSKW